MTIAISEIMQQVKLLSLEEQVELAARVTEQARQTIQAMSVQPQQTEANAAADGKVQEQEQGEADNWLDTLDLKIMPPKRTYTVTARFHKVGRLQPLPYDFGDFFDEESEG